MVYWKQYANRKKYAKDVVKDKDCWILILSNRKLSCKVTFEYVKQYHKCRKSKFVQCDALKTLSNIKLNFFGIKIFKIY